MNNTEIEFFAPILDAALSAHGGFSFNPFTKTFVVPGTGSTYAVSVPGFEQEISEEVFSGRPAIAAYLTRLSGLGLLSVPANSYQLLVGAWRDKDNKVVYLDLSVLAHNRHAAAQLAVQNNQLSFYDFEKKEVVWVRDAKTREVLPAYLPYVFPQGDGRATDTRQCTGEKPYVDAWSREVRLNPRGA